MKTYFFILLFLSGCLLSRAQTDKYEEKTEFRPHWYLQLQGGIGYTLGEAAFKDLLSPAAGLSAGWQFKPAWALRFGASGWQAKGSWVSPRENYKYNYAQLNADMLFDLANGFGNYHPRRFFNPYLFLGIGCNYAFNNDEARDIDQSGHHLEYLWEDSRVFASGRGGIGANFRICEAVSFNLEGNANLLSDHFNSKKAANADWHFNVLAGFTFRLGKSHSVRKEVPRELPQPQPVVRKEEPKQEPVKESEVKEEPEVPVIKEVREDIFFTLNSSEIRESETSKVRSLADFLKKHAEVRVMITGYADAATGNPRYNKALSLRRAEEVAKALTAEGIAKDRITVTAKGDTEQPFALTEQNRVAICITR